MIDITYDVLDPDTITEQVKKDSNGAVVTFLGVTRNSTGDRNVLFLEYEAYRPHHALHHHCRRVLGFR